MTLNTLKLKSDAAAATLITDDKRFSDFYFSGKVLPSLIVQRS